MTGQQKATYALAALLIVCASILGGLGILSASLVMGAYGLAMSGVGWYHALAPGQAAPMPPPAGGAP